MTFDYENSNHFFNRYNGILNIPRLKNKLFC